MSLIKRYWIMIVLGVFILVYGGIQSFLIFVLINAAIYFYMKKSGRRHLLPRRRKKIKVREDLGFENDEIPIKIDHDNESELYTFGMNDALVGNPHDHRYEEDPNYLMGYNDYATT